MPNSHRHISFLISKFHLHEIVRPWEDLLKKTKARHWLSVQHSYLMSYKNRITTQQVTYNSNCWAQWNINTVKISQSEIAALI
jgi:hypothetical protein